MTPQTASTQLDLFAASAEPVESASSRSESLDDRSAHEVGALHEKALERAGERKRGGAYYTPPDVVERLLDLCLDPMLAERSKRGVAAVQALRVLDPACGSGNFLVAVAARLQRTLESLGLPSSEAARIAFGECVAGIDVDATAVELCRSSLANASRATVSEEALHEHVICADALAIGADAVAQNPESYPIHASLLADVTEIMLQQARSALDRTADLVVEALRSNTDRTEDQVKALQEKLQSPLIELPKHHGAIFGAADAKTAGLPVKEADPRSDQWKLIWLLWARYFSLFPSRIYEGRRASRVIDPGH